MIPCGNPKAQYFAHKDAIDAALRTALEGGGYILGENVRAFEREAAAHLGVRHAIGVGSGTDALHVALRTCGIGSGHEVITVSHTAVATVAAIELAGATPVFADIEPEFHTLDPVQVERLISPDTKAILAVHLYGQPADVTRLRTLANHHGLRLIEDCAQAHGARHGQQRVGSLGDIACFSFYPTKNLGAIGDGGMVVTQDDRLAERCRLLREYGWAERYVSSVPGLNSRLDEVQAAILRAKLPHLDVDNERRAAIASVYDKALAGTAIRPPARRPGTTHVFHLYVVRCQARDRLLTHLKANDIGALIHYPVPVHRQPAYAGRIRGSEALPETERAAAEVASLPMFPELVPGEISRVTDALRAFTG